MISVKKLIGYTLPTLLLAAGCIERKETVYIKDSGLGRGVRVVKVTHGEKEEVQFYSGETLVRYESVNGLETITLLRGNNVKQYSGDPNPLIPEVKNLKKLIDRYRINCVLMDEKGDVAHLPRSAASYIKSCYEKSDISEVKECLILGAPENWRVDCD